MIYQSDDNRVHGVVCVALLTTGTWPQCSTRMAHVCDRKSLYRHAPFMSIDILDATCLQHLYRHDLEPFFYIFVWCAC